MLAIHKKEKKIKEAVAIKYSPESDRAPRVIASGKGETAENILEKAKENDIPIYQDETLAHTLNALNLGDEIPSELYEVVAEVLVFISGLDKSFGEKYARKE